MTVGAVAETLKKGARGGNMVSPALDERFALAMADRLHELYTDWRGS